MDNWIKANVIALLVLAASGVSTYVTMQTRIAGVESVLNERTALIVRASQLNEAVQAIKTEQEVSQRYWDKFEDIIDQNTKALNSISTLVAVSTQELDRHEKRIEKLEDMK